MHGDSTAEHRQNPHVQSYLMATDQVPPDSPLITPLQLYPWLQCLQHMCLYNSHKPENPYWKLDLLHMMLALVAVAVLEMSLLQCMCMQEGLEVLQQDGLVFECYESLHDTVWNSELGSAVAIFKAGYTIDSLMLKYQGANWSNTNNWNCNAGCVSLTQMLCVSILTAFA